MYCFLCGAQRSGVGSPLSQTANENGDSERSLQVTHGDKETVVRNNDSTEPTSLALAVYYFLCSTTVWG